MKIYKVNLDPSNPIEKLVKVPVGSDYGIQINWDNEKYPVFTDSEVTTQNGYLVSENVTATEMTDITTVAGQKTFLGENNVSLPKVNNVGDTIVWVYNPTETTDKTASTFGSIKILGVDADDFEIDLGSSGGGSEIKGIYNDQQMGGYFGGYFTPNVVIGDDAQGQMSTIEDSLGLQGDFIMIATNNSFIQFESDGAIHLAGKTGINHNTKTTFKADVDFTSNININGTAICLTKFLNDYGYTE